MSPPRTGVIPPASVGGVGCKWREAGVGVGVARGRGTGHAQTFFNYHTCHFVFITARAKSGKDDSLVDQYCQHLERQLLERNLNAGIQTGGRLSLPS